MCSSKDITPISSKSIINSQVNLDNNPFTERRTYVWTADDRTFIIKAKIKAMLSYCQKLGVVTAGLMSVHDEAGGVSFDIY